MEVEYDSKKQLFLPHTKQEENHLLPLPVQVHRAQHYRNTGTCLTNSLQRAPGGCQGAGARRGDLSVQVTGSGARAARGHRELGQEPQRLLGKKSMAFKGIYSFWRSGHPPGSL